MLRMLNGPNGALSVVFVGIRKMRSLNLSYLRKDYATDVLSFSYEGTMMDGMPFLGEIVIAPEIAEIQAVRFRSSPEKELRKLLVHGILHLMGYDHETDHGRMNRYQSRILRKKLFTDGPRLSDLKRSYDNR
jgi:probable rRNA maturation factor